MPAGASLLPVDMPNCPGVGRPTAGDAFAGCQQKGFPHVGLLLDGNQETCLLVRWLYMHACVGGGVRRGACSGPSWKAAGVCRSLLSSRGFEA